MYDDMYAECLVRSKMTGKAILGLVTLIFSATVSLILAITFPSWGFFVLALVVIGIFVTFRYLKVDYEYIFVQGELQADRIYSEAIRKKGPRIDIPTCEGIFPVTEEEIQREKSNGVAIDDYSSHDKTHSKYGIKYAGQDKMHLFVFEPDANLLKQFRLACPNKLR